MKSQTRSPSVSIYFGGIQGNHPKELVELSLALDVVFDVFSRSIGRWRYGVTEDEQTELSLAIDKFQTRCLSVALFLEFSN